MYVNPVRVAGRLIGNGNPSFIAAEIGINHNGDMDLAVKMIDAAIESGCDSVKFQNYKTSDLFADDSLQYTYISQGKEVTESQLDMFNRYELSREQLFLLKNYCEKKGIIFFSTPSSRETLEDLVAINTPLLKNGSDALVNHSLIRDMAKTKIPTVLSTGMAVLGEIDDSVRAFKDAGGTDLILLHCTSSYPTPLEDVNLRKIQTLESTFLVPVGFSDHTDGSLAAIGSIVFNACFIEKHFTLDKNLPGPDHRFSSDPKELSQLIRDVRMMETCLGTSIIGPTASESHSRLNYRFSCAAKSDLSKGQKIREEDIIFLKPSTGIPPSSISALVGKTLLKDMKKGQQFSYTNFE